MGAPLFTLAADRVENGPRVNSRSSAEECMDGPLKAGRRSKASEKIVVVSRGQHGSTPWCA